MAKKGKGLAKTSAPRARIFFCRTYLTELQLKMLLLTHQMQIRVYAYALHDKDVFSEDQVDKDTGEIRVHKGDPKESHYHVILSLYNGNSISGVKRWFSFWKDEEGNDVNSDVEVCLDKNVAYDYLTHSTRECVLKGDFQYDKEIIVCNDKNYFNGHYTSELDSAQLILLDMFSGTSYAELAMKYGRDFILNFDRYRFACEKIYYEGSFTRLQKEIDDLRNVKESMDETAAGHDVDEDPNDEFVEYYTEEVSL